MGIKKTIEINGKQIPMEASAATPRLYRIKFGRDVFKDLVKVNIAEGDESTILESEFFENVAYIMAKKADDSVPDSIEEWLESLSMFDLCDRSVRSQIMELWDLNSKQNEKSKKKQEQPNES